MGNELSQAQRQGHDVGSDILAEALGAALREILSDRQTSITPTQIEHAWDPDDCSENFSVLDDEVTARRGRQGHRTDLVRGKKGYRTGTHSFEIYWPDDERGSHAMVGVSMPEAPKSCVGYSYLLGSTKDSWGWCLVDRKLVHNGKVLGVYPKGKANFEVPEIFHVIINADEGTLSFRADDQDLGVAFKNLPRQNLLKPLCICASSTYGNGDVRMKYMGNEGGISQVTSTGEQIVTVPAPTGSSFYKFHPRCGDSIDVMHSGRVAMRRNATDDFNDGVVLTRQPLKVDERFEVRMDTKINRWSGSLEIGFTSNKPEELEFPTTMTECRDGTTLMWSGANVYKNGEKVSELEVDLDDCTVGDTVGIERKGDGSVQFFFNGDCLKKAVKLKSGPTVAYGVVDLYGQAGSVTICESESAASAGEPQSPRPPSKTNVSSNDPNAIMFEMRKTVALMKRGSDVDMRVALERVAVTLLKPYHDTENDKIRQRFGDHLANLDGGHELTKLLRRLNDMGMESELAWTGMEIVRSTCWNYCDASLKIGSQFGRSGLLELMLEDLDRYGPRQTTNQKRRFIVMSALSILHNSAKISENKQVYRDIRAVERIAPFMKSDDMELAMIAMLTLSYVVEENKVRLLEANDDAIAYLIGLLKSACGDPDLHGHSDASRYSAFEIVKGLGHIAANDTNKKRIVNMGAVPLLVDLMKMKDRPMEQECAANAVWALAKLDENKREISSTAGLMPTLAALARSDNAAVKQAAERAIMRVKPVPGQVLGGKAKAVPSCDYRKLCERFKNSLKLSDVFFEGGFDMCYCTTCHDSRGDQLYYARGSPAKDYAVPIGWCRFALKVPPRVEALQAFQKWHVAFHGTRLEAIESILTHGQLMMPGDTLMGGKKLSELPGHFTPDRKPEGFDTKQLFLSPSIRYAGCDVYAAPTRYKDETTKKAYGARVVFQVCIIPGGYKVGPETIGARSEIDPKFSNQEIEWFTRAKEGVILYGLLVKLE